MEEIKCERYAYRKGACTQSSLLYLASDCAHIIFIRVCVAGAYLGVGDAVSRRWLQADPHGAGSRPHGAGSRPHGAGSRSLGGCPPCRQPCRRQATCRPVTGRPQCARDVHLSPLPPLLPSIPVRLSGRSRGGCLKGKTRPQHSPRV